MLAKLYKLLFDISVCFSIGAFLLKYIKGSTVYGSGFLILSVTALLCAFWAGNRKLKILTCILIPVGYIGYLYILSPAFSNLSVFLLIWAYFVYVVVTDRLVIGRGEFIDMLRRLLYLSIILLFPMVTAFHKFSIAMQTASPYLTAAILSAVFLLRHLRSVHKMEQVKQYRRQQLLELIGFITLSLLLTLAKAPQNLVEGFKQLYLHVIEPVLGFLISFFGMLLYGILKLLISLIRPVSGEKEIEIPKFIFGKQEDLAIGSPDTVADGMDWLLPILYAAGAILMIALLFLFFRWLMGERFKGKLPAGIQETREYLDEEGEKRGSFFRRRPRESREYVRYYYGKSLLWLRHRKVPIKPSDTTEEISEKYLTLQAESSKEGHEVRKEASVQLKKLYRKARYQMEEDIAAGEAEQAKQLYQAMKNTAAKR